MGIGGIGSAYGVGSIYPSYVYNPNTVSAKSMDKLSRISDDVLDKKVDYSETTAESVEKGTDNRFRRNRCKADAAGTEPRGKAHAEGTCA